MKQYDYLIVGAGLYGSICAYELTKRGLKCLVIDKREHIGGNCYTENKEGIHVHTYGPHIFHTNDKRVWDWINQFAEFNSFVNRPIAKYNNEILSLPFNMWTFNKLWGVETPKGAMSMIESQRFKGKPTNLEEQALSLVGKDVYEILIKGYTEKQWRKKCTELPPSIIKRLPVRFTYDNNYFNDKYQGIPIGGYTQIFDKLLDGIEVRLNVDYFKDKEELNSISDKVIYTGPIDRFFDYEHGQLEYKSVRWEDEWHETDNYQGNAIVNYTSIEVPHTRTIEHRHFDDPGPQVKRSYVSTEFPQEYVAGKVEPFYPVNDKTNNEIYDKYKKMGEETENVFFGGRLGTYKYYDMHQVIAQALKDCESYS
jgi:UDP-galactopyranose mutase